MRWVPLALLAMSCGRVGFDPHGGTAGVGDANGDGRGDATMIACADNDGTCPSPSCVGSDNDCVNVCGDNLCVGNAGEKCQTCMADCATTAVVCGNGHCDVGEDGASCQTDCGPSPWPQDWAQQATDFVTMLSATRMAGYTCPGSTMMTAGALVQGPDPTQGARHLAWEIVHQPNFGAGECNGTSVISDTNDAGYAGAIYGGGGTTASSALSAFLSQSGTCLRMMMGQYTMAAPGMAIEGARDAWVVFFK